MPARDDLRTVAVAGTVDEAAARLRAVIQERGLTLFAEIDHQQNARDVGLDMPAARVLIFGSARAGTPLMLSSPDIALELPLRVLVREQPDGGAVFVYLAPERLAASFDVESQAASIAGLNAIVQAAVA
jgi:uncharacterized protein (DUF302 family)